MASMTTVETPNRPITHRGDELDPDAHTQARAVASLGSWMVGLGVIRLAFAIAGYAQAWREAWASGEIASQGWAEFFNENAPVSVLINGWPLLLGLALRRTRWPELVKASALTFLILSVGGVLSAMADWSRDSSRWIAIGSFHVPHAAWGRVGAAAMAPVLAGAAQWLLEFATAVWALRLAFRLPDGGHPGEDRRAGARRSRGPARRGRRDRLPAADDPPTLPDGRAGADQPVAVDQGVHPAG